jgi:LPXTG-site transpeptidase (sortase) family protein
VSRCSRSVSTGGVELGAPLSRRRLLKIALAALAVAAGVASRRALALESDAPGGAREPAQQGPSILPPLLTGPVTQQNRVVPVVARNRVAVSYRALVPDRLVFPSIDLDARIVPIGVRVDPDGQLVWETAPFAVGHHQGSGTTGDAGNVVLWGHISSPREGAVFNRLPYVEPGDGLVIASAERSALYRVVRTWVVSPGAVEYIEPTDDAVATLVTCVPDGVYTQRLIVRAALVT